MKKLILFLCLVAAAGSSVWSQSRKNSASKSVARKASGSTVYGAAKADTVISLTSTSSFNAKSNTADLSIADPIVRTFNERAQGNPVRISNSGIVGMPKRAYGFANGRILLHSTTATTSGTSTGMPSVGTGSTLSTIGSTGPFIGLNGKSPDAGSAMWGNARGLVNPNSTMNH